MEQNNPCIKCLRDRNVIHFHYFNKIYYYKSGEKLPTIMVECLCEKNDSTKENSELIFINSL